MYENVKKKINKNIENLIIVAFQYRYSMHIETGFSSVSLKPFSVVVVLERMEQHADCKWTCYPPIRKNQPPGNGFEEE